MYLRKTVSALALLLSTHAALAQPTSRPADEKEAILSLLVDVQVAMVVGDDRLILANAIIPDGAEPQFKASGELFRVRCRLFQNAATRFEVPREFRTFKEENVRRQLQVLRDSTVTMNGNEAVVQLPGGRGTTPFKKRDGKWKADMSGMTGLIPVDELRKRTALYVDVNRALQAGELKSFADFEAAMTARGLDWKSARP